jgi:molybdate transport system regulatory protein
MIKKTEKKQYKVNGRIWIDCEESSFIGHGRIELLKKTKELGSLRKAAMELNMSYAQAWYNMDKMNKSAPTPLIILHRGGKEGGIAQITEMGEEVLHRYKKLQKKFDIFLKKQTKRLHF